MDNHGTCGQMKQLPGLPWPIMTRARFLKDGFAAAEFIGTDAEESSHLPVIGDILECVCQNEQICSQKYTDSTEAD